MPPKSERTAPAGLREGDRPANEPDPQCLRPTIFRRAPKGALSIAKQNSRPSPSSADTPALRFAAGAGPSRPPKIAFTAGLDFNDHQLIWAKLDQVHARHPDMVLMHGKSPKGGEKIASCWADHRKVPQIGFAPDWTRHAKAAPFKRNDAMLELLPIGVIVFPGTGIQDNLADKAKKLGIPVLDFRPKGGGA